MADPVSVGTAVRIVYGVGQALGFLGPGETKQQRERKRAAMRAGYIPIRAGKGSGAYFRGPDGRIYSKRQIRQIGAGIIATERAQRRARRGLDATASAPAASSGGAQGAAIAYGYEMAAMGPTRTREPTKTPPIRPPGPAPGLPRYEPRGPMTTPRPKYKSPIDPKFERQRAEKWERARRAPDPKPRPKPRIIDPNLPPYRAPPGVLARLLRLAGRSLGVLAWLLLPTDTATDDTIPGPMPGDERGPQRRPRVRPDRAPEDVPEASPQPPEAPQPVPQPPNAPTSLPEPIRPELELPEIITPPQVFEPPEPIPLPPSPPSPLSIAAPLLGPVILSAIQPGPGSATRLPLTPPQAPALESPSGRPPDQDRCKCPKSNERRKRKNDACRNPITNRRTYTRDGVKYRTITRKLECPALSRKKLR